MALVRCPTHKIPYNDENPRGCPACAREKDGGGEAAIMQELARATRRAAGLPPKPEQTPPAQRPSASGARPITAPPRAPAAEPSRIVELLWQVGRPRTIVVGVGLIIALGALLILISGPRFVPQLHPASYEGPLRPLPIEPNEPITLAFAVLGTQPPQTHPTVPGIARYSYGTDLQIDALNGRIYAITLGLPNRSWRGVRVGATRLNAEGALALLGTPNEQRPPAGVSAEVIEGYVVYPSLNRLPVRILQAEVRPPNGCYDVQAELRPKVVGILRDKKHRYAVIGPEGTQPDWVVTRIRIISRSMGGPYAPGTAC